MRIPTAVFRKRYFLYAGAVFWAVLVTGIILSVSFPYQKMVKILFQDIAAGSGSRISFADARRGLMGAFVSSIRVGNHGVEGKPLYEIERVTLRWNPFSLVGAGPAVSARAFAYGGEMDYTVYRMPSLSSGPAKLDVRLSGINLARYPEGRLPWLKGMTGVMKGTIARDVNLIDREQEKGTFSFMVKEGELKEAAFKDGSRVSLPFKELVVEGRIKGERWDVDRVYLKGNGYAVKGLGVIEGSGAGAVVDLKLDYQSSADGAPLTGKGSVMISGDLWSPEVVRERKAGSRTVVDFEQSEFYRKHKVRTKGSVPLKAGGAGTAYVYEDGEDPKGAVEVLLGPDSRKIDSVRVSWRSGDRTRPPGFTEGREQFLKDLLFALEPRLETGAAIEFVQNEQEHKYKDEGAMTKEKIEKLEVCAGTVGLALIVGISFLPGW